MIRMMRSAAFLILLLTASGSIAIGQVDSADAKPGHDGKITVTYDAANNETKIRLDEMAILENKSESLSMILVGSFTGHKPLESPSEVLLLLNASSMHIRYQTEPTLVITADGVIVRTRDMKNYGTRKKGDRILEPLLTMMPYDVLEKMTRAKTVILRINDAEYELTSNNLEALRDFARRLIPEKSN